MCKEAGGGGGRRRRSPGYRIKNKNPTQRCGEQLRGKPNNWQYLIPNLSKKTQLRSSPM